MLGRDLKVVHESLQARFVAERGKERLQAVDDEQRWPMDEKLAA